MVGIAKSAVGLDEWGMMAAMAIVDQLLRMKSRVVAAFEQGDGLSEVVGVYMSKEGFVLLALGIL